MKKTIRYATLLLLTMICTMAGAQTTTLWSNYAPNGETFSKTVSFDQSTQEIRAEIDLSGCLYSNENILSIGNSISVWNGTGVYNLHIYYTKSSNSILVSYLNNYVRKDDTVNPSGTTVTIVLDKDGVWIDGQLLTTNTASVLSNLLGLSSLQVGSEEGQTRSYATYNTVVVEPYSEKYSSDVPTVGSTYYIKPAADQSKALAITTTSNDDPLLTSTFADGNEKQQWVVKSSGNSSYPYMLVSTYSSLGLDLAINSEEGTPVTPCQWTSSSDNGNQCFALELQADGSYIIKAMRDSKIRYLATDGTATKRVSAASEATDFVFAKVQGGGTPPPTHHARPRLFLYIVDSRPKQGGRL